MQYIRHCTVGKVVYPCKNQNNLFSSLAYQSFGFVISHSDIVTPVALAVSAQSPRNFQLEFSGLTRRNLCSSPFTTRSSSNELHRLLIKRSTNFNTYNVAIQLPAVLPATGDGDGVFYLEDA
ncbi:hypothetical protein DSO57_1037840 [Entomophthora muscae]|uniref:Uncharacterized protein n=1 Tax=Entomophthora muscae TaxID=34485 RepID=A0ACC2SMW1_9FUNG|nr:hypothetical protein DSO57_1037840 [Entomophthora muscae]